MDGDLESELRKLDEYYADLLRTRLKFDGRTKYHVAAIVVPVTVIFLTVLVLRRLDLVLFMLAMAAFAFAAWALLEGRRHQGWIMAWNLAIEMVTYKDPELVTRMRVAQLQRPSSAEITARTRAELAEVEKRLGRT